MLYKRVSFVYLIGTQNPAPVETFTYKEPDSNISPSCPITYFRSYSAWSAKSIGGCREVGVVVARWVWLWGGGCGVVGVGG